MSAEQKNLGNLSPAKGSHRDRKRLGRGHASGQGKTSGKGHKGQKARTGGKVAPGFEGGQTPLYRRLPKRGFTPLQSTEFNIINIEQLNSFDAGSIVDVQSLNDKGLLKKIKNPVKILGRGELSKSLTVKVNKASKTAQAAIEKAGGNIEFSIFKKAPKKSSKKPVS